MNYNLEGLSKEEGRSYIQEKLKGAGCNRTVFQEAAVEATPTPISADDEETITGLVMKPTTGSWMGEHVCILEGVVGTGRRITISYTYSGDRLEGAMLEVSFKDTTGTPVGEIITSNGTVYDDSYTLEANVDGSSWPNKMIIDFSLNGVIIDSFECELFPKY